jgi:GT2 family glycosyltransferase
VEGGEPGVAAHGQDDATAGRAAATAELSAQAHARAEDALDRFLPPDEAGIRRDHRVHAVLLAHEGARWLPRAIDALTGQARPPDSVVGVDAGSTDASRRLLADALGEVVRADPRAGLAGAAAAAIATLPSPQGHDDPDGQPAWDPRATPDPTEDGPVTWYWILHDDTAPQPDCLEQLLQGADRNPAAVVVVPKTVAWSDPNRLVGIGARWAPGTPVVDRLEPFERDQGQYDVDRPVYAGDSAGLLVRVDAWHALGGFDPGMGDWAGPADLCRRAWGSGGEVWFVPRAVVAHRQAGHHGVRPTPDQPVPRRAARHGQLLLELTQSPGWALPWRWVRAWLATMVRAVALLLTREPEEAIAELRGAWDALVHPRRLRRARRSVRRAPVRSLTRPPHVRATRGAVLGHALDAWAAARPPTPTSPRSWLPRRLWWPLGIALALTAASLVREPAQLLGAGTLRGGGLLPAPGAMDLLTGYLASWQEVRFGAPSAQPAYLPILAAASAPLLGSVDLLLRLLVGLAVPLAFLGAWACAGPWLAGWLRILAALAWAVLPAGVAAIGAARPSTLAVLLLAPWVVRALHRAAVAARAGRRALRRSIAAGTLLGILGAFAPATWLLAILVGPLAWMARGRPRWALRPALVVLACSSVFVVLWLPAVLAAPWRVLDELGRVDLQLATPPAWVAGLSPGGPTAIVWAGVPVLLLAIVAVVLRPTGRRLVVLALAGALLALVAWLQPLVERLWSDAPARPLWPGQLLLVAGGLLVALVTRSAAGRPAEAGGADAVARLLRAGAVGCLAVLLVGWWAAPTLARVGTGTGVPAVVTLAQDSPERPRALVLGRDEDGASVRYAVATTTQARLGDPEALASPDPAFTEVVAGLVAGAAGDLEVELGGRGVRYVVFGGPQEDPLVAELDAAIGLRRLASAPEQSLWLVAGQPVRAELSAVPGAGEVVVPVRPAPSSIDVVLHPQTPLPRSLLLAEVADPGWRATVDGQPLVLAADPRGMLTAPIAATGRLTVEHASTWSLLALLQLLAMAVLVVLALPKRGPVDPDSAVTP